MDDLITKGLSGLAGLLGAGAWGRWLLNKRDERMTRIEEEHEKLRDHVSRHYMPEHMIRAEFNRIEHRIDKGQDETRSDIKGLSEKIERGFQRLHDKLDGKVDK